MHFTLRLFRVNPLTVVILPTGVLSGYIQLLTGTA
jgi:hypothetical protein